VGFLKLGTVDKEGEGNVGSIRMRPGCVFLYHCDGVENRGAQKKVLPKKTKPRGEP